MNVRTSALAVVLLLATTACPGQGPGPIAPAVDVELESLYLDDSVAVATNTPPARSISLRLTGRSDAEMTGTLVLDPNTCSLNAFGDPQICTLIAVRGIEVVVRRLAITDPSNLMRRYYEVTGEGLPQGMALIVRGELEEGGLDRGYLVVGSELVPLYVEDEV
jgi:hypothetical protein